MIFSGIINAIYYLVWLVTQPIRLLNDVTLPTNFSEAMHTAGGYISPLNFVLPVDTILTLLTLSLLIEGAYFAYKLTMWVIKRFPTQS
jgi:hypothetical protein